MTADTIMLVLGGGLVAAAALGGGIEVKEIKVASLSTGKRITAGIMGGLLLFLGLVMWLVMQPDPPKSPESVTQSEK